MTDVEMTFNPDPFIKAIEMMGETLGQFTTEMKEFARKTQEFFKKSDNEAEKGSGQIQKKTKETGGLLSETFSSLITKLGGLGAAYLSVRGIMSGIPEIGKTFSIAGEIFQKNFLWPLRKELMPYLQKFLDWVRDNRAMFVRWGQVLANIFRGIVTIVKGAIDLVRPIIKAVQTVLEKIFGNTAKNISDILNILIFRIVVVAQFLIITLQPVFDFIGKAVVAVSEAFGNLFEGVMSGLDEAMGGTDGFITLMKDLWTSIQELWQSIKDIFGAEDWGTFMEVLKTIGWIIGSVIGGAIKKVIQTITAFIKLVTGLVQFLSSGSTKGFDKAFDYIGKIAEEDPITKLHRQKQQQQGLDESGQPLVKPNALTSGKTFNANQKVNIEKMEIVVPKGEEEKSGKKFVKGMADKGRDGLIQAFKEDIERRSQDVGA